MEQMQPSQMTETPALESVVTDVLGDLAFMVSEDSVSEARTDTIWLHGRIEYEGPIRGEVSCWCTREFALQLAANLLGVEPDAGDALVATEDAFSEYLNVLCGHLVTRWHGTEAVFNLTIPEVVECEAAPELAALNVDQKCSLVVDGECLYAAHAELQGG